MLTLRRKTGEAIIIEGLGVEVYLKVTKIENNEVHLSFDAEKEISIQRDELHRAKERAERKNRMALVG